MEPITLTETELQRYLRLHGVLHDPVDPVGDERRRCIALARTYLTGGSNPSDFEDFIAAIELGEEAP